MILYNSNLVRNIRNEQLRNQKSKGEIKVRHLHLMYRNYSPEPWIILLSVLEVRMTFNHPTVRIDDECKEYPSGGGRCKRHSRDDL